MVDMRDLKEEYMYAGKNMSFDNLTIVDKAVRYGMAGAFIGQIFFETGVMSWQGVLVMAGVYFATTALCGVDPFYKLFSRGHSRGALDHVQVAPPAGRVAGDAGDFSAANDNEHKVA